MLSMQREEGGRMERERRPGLMPHAGRGIRTYSTEV